MKEIIVIPSRDRAELLMARKNSTLHYVAESNYASYLAVRECEIESYASVSNRFGITLLGVPDEVDTIAKTYDFVFTVFSDADKILMLDDDLIFGYRVDYSDTKLAPLIKEHFDMVVDSLFFELDQGAAMSGIAHRRGAQNYTEVLRFNQKLIAVMACDVQCMKGFKWEWEANSMFDHHMVLQLLSNGFTNTLITKYTHDDIFKRFAHGGCESYRSLEVHSQAAKALANKFPETVKLREKWMPEHQEYGYDVTMYMKKSFGDRDE